MIDEIFILQARDYFRFDRLLRLQSLDLQGSSSTFCSTGILKVKREIPALAPMANQSSLGNCSLIEHRKAMRRRFYDQH